MTLACRGIRGATTSPCAKASGFVFVTGQVAVKPSEDGKQARGEIGEMGTLEEQTVRVMENVKAILEEAGTTLAHVVKRNIYLTHAGDFDEVHQVIERYFGPMATTTVVAGLIPTSSRVEIDVIAVLP